MKFLFHIRERSELRKEVNGADFKEWVHSVNSLFGSAARLIEMWTRVRIWSVTMWLLMNCHILSTRFYKRGCAARAGVVERVLFGPFFVWFASSASFALASFSVSVPLLLWNLR